MTLKCSLLMLLSEDKQLSFCPEGPKTRHSPLHVQISPSTRESTVFNLISKVQVKSFSVFCHFSFDVNVGLLIDVIVLSYA